MLLAQFEQIPPLTQLACFGVVVFLIFIAQPFGLLRGNGELAPDTSCYAKFGMTVKRSGGSHSEGLPWPDL
jgi:hypothetical protein